MLLCLQSNALKFTRNGEVHIVVTIDEEYLYIEVRDQGIGISKEDQKKLFKLFGFLEESQQMNKNGVGLGLYIAKQITNQFEGDIDVDSELGEGSNFTIKFKIYQSEERSEGKDSDG